jgi:hypothetical protein
MSIYVILLLRRNIKDETATTQTNAKFAKALGFVI